MILNLDKPAWKRVTFSDVARHVTDRVNPETSGLERFLAGGHIPSRSLQIRGWGVIGQDPIGPMFYKRFRPGHVLYLSRETHLRKTAVPEFTGICGEKTFVLETRDQGVLSQEFLPFLLSAERFHTYAMRMSRGSVNTYINWGDIARYEFDLPPLDEQRRIADLFWSVERHRRSIPVDQLKQSEEIYLRNIIGKAAGTPMPITTLGSVLLGRILSPEHATGDHMMPYLRVANVGDDELRLDDVKQMNFTPDEQKRYALSPGDIVISEGQSRELVGQSALITALPEPTFFQKTLIRFRPDTAVIRPEYVQALFRVCVRDGTFSRMAPQTTSIAHLTVQRFSQLRLTVPDLAEQDRLLSGLRAIQTAREAARIEVAALTALDRRLSSEIFGGAS